MTEIEDGPAFQNVVEHLGQGIALFNATRDLVVANALFQALLDLPAELAAPGTGLADIISFLVRRGDFGAGDPVSQTKCRLNEIEQDPAPQASRCKHADKHLEIVARHLPDGHLLLSYADITARVLAERELETINRTLEARVNERTQELTRLNRELERARAKADAANIGKTRFLAAASHDLLQPLNAARLYTSAMIETAQDSAVAALAHNIDAALLAVEDLMSALLDISRFDSGARKPALSVFPIRELLGKIRIEFEPAAAEKFIRLRTVDTGSAVNTDRRLVARILQNLVSNAIKYTADGGAVLVGCRRRGNAIRLDIVDNGIGIEQSRQSLIFAEFSRLEAGARMAPGIGLGLSIVQRVCTILDIQLEIVSNVGKGSRFSIYLPVAATAAPDKSAPAARIQPSPHSQFSNRQILCVDNEQNILDAMQLLLSGWGCDVRTATSLRAIVQTSTLENWLPDLVLMDFHLDQTSGLDAIEWLRQTVGGHLPAALVTADRSPQVRKLAASRDVVMLPKPVKPAALRALISRLW